MNPHGALPENLRVREAGEALRWIALAEIERAVACCRSLAQGGDLEALHDFRVALRRLRGHLRAYREELSGTTKKSAYRRLRRIAAATNPGRDAEVGLELVARWSAASAGAERRALAVLAADLERRREEAYETLRSDLLPAFDRVSQALDRDLRRYEVELRLSPGGAGPETFGEIFAGHFSEQGQALLAALGEASGKDDELAIHRARIAAKRLRYLVDPLLVELGPVRPLVAQLKELQDTFGGACDLAVLAERLAALGARAERERLLALAGGVAVRPSPGGRAGRQAIARRIGRERRQLGRDIRSLWLAAPSRKLTALEMAIAALAVALAEPLKPADRPEPEPVS